ncbi:AAA family ATPase [Kaistella sp.]|uniref:AAA family ATPase n=1 Tax=Kaistella sp. TaxID=2782235 RepID=UPI00359F9462
MSEGELIFTYINNSKFGLKKQSINFSDNFEVAYFNGDLTINRKEKNENFFGKSVSNISLIIGKNGAGKSSILQLISFDKKSRKKYLPNTVFFSIYFVRDNEYYFEGSPSLARKILNNGDFNKEEFFFKIENEQITYVPPKNKPAPFITTIYQTLFPNISWSEKKKLNSSSGGFIAKRYTNSVGVDKVMNFMSNHLSDNEEFNAEFTFRQKQKYNSKPGELLFLYEATIDDVNFELLRNKELGYQQFLDEFKIINTEDRNYYHQEKYDSPNEKLLNEKKARRDHYIRTNQDKIYNDDIRGYFVLRMLEKIYLSQLHNLEWTINGEKTYQSKRKILERVQEFKKNSKKWSKIGNTNDVYSKIDFLQFLLDDCFDKRKEDSLGGLYELTHFIMELPEELFENSNQFVLDIKTFSRHELVSTIVKNFSNIFDIKARNLSDGQYVYCSTFTQIFEAVKEDTDCNLLLVLDEPDINMHPEWSRCFINNVLELIPSFTNKKVQLVISTHSPFLVSDIPSSNVYQIQGEGNNKQLSTVDKSFAANIFDIISGGFYLEYPIGEFARKKIDTIKSKKSNIINLIDDPFLAYVLTRGDK